MASFYDLDYIIDINEKRLEQYTAAYQKNVEKFTNIMVVYSGFAIFLIPIVQSLFFTGAKCHFLHHFTFYCFLFLFGYSLLNTIRLLIPVNVAYLKEPKIYYRQYRLKYESLASAHAPWPREVDNLIKSSYINELENAVNVNDALFKRKGLFYRQAFMWAIYAVAPYLICLGFQLSAKNEKIQKVEIINNFRNLNKTNYHGK